MKSTFEKMGGNYTLGTDGIYYPNLVSTDEKPHYGKYGMLRKTYLMEHRKPYYQMFMLQGKLNKHLNRVDREAHERMDILVAQMAEKQKILVVDDEPEIREVLQMMLSSEGYEITEACNAQEAVEKASGKDLVILDIMMPGESGIAACTKIREKNNVPILFLTAKSGEHDKVLGFSAGGDDYLVKPFSYMELLSRVKALIRRYKVYQKQEEKEEELVCYRDITIDPDLQTVQAAGEKIALTEMEYQILLLLISHPRKVFSVKEIYELVWKEEFLPNSGNTVMVHIRNIRRKLEKKGESYIQNIWGRGYCVN